MSFLFGSAPSVKTTTAPTVSPQQTALLTQLQQLLSGGGTPPGVQPYGGSFAAPLNPLQTSSLQGLENLANTTIPNLPQLDPNQVLGAESKALSYGGPGQVTAPQVSPSFIDATQAFQTGVVDPLTEDFNTRILPGIIGQYGRGAGGAYSSDAFNAREQAGTDLERTLAGEGSKFAYSAAAANQQAKQQADLANQAATLSSEGSNVSANEFAQQARLAAISGAPAAAGVPGVAPSIIEQLFGGTLSAGAVPYSVAQTQTSGEYSDFLNQLSQKQQTLADLIGSFSPQTLSTTSVASGGSTGLIPGLLTGAASNSALFGGIGNQNIMAKLLGLA